MRTINAVRSPFIWAGLLLLTFLTAGNAEDVSRDPRREWFNLAQGRTEFEVSDPELVPSFLRLAAEQSGCLYRDGLKVAPLRFLRVANSRLVLIACWGSLKGTVRAFDLSNLRKPVAIRFPVVAYPDGIGTSDDAPGVLTWESETGLFQAETTSDVAYTTRTRHTYRFDGTSSFVVLRVEIQRDGAGEWIEIWKAPRWSSLVKPN